MKPKRATKSSRRPFLFINMAMTADGKIATANRAVSSFGSERDKRHLLELRATADAVMAGARTVDMNKVNMGPGPERYRKARLQKGLAEHNLRIIVSRSGSVNPKAHIFTKRFSPIIILTTQAAGPAKIEQLRKVADEVRVCGRNNIHWPGALAWLRSKWKVKRLLCEGGGELNDALFRGGFVDELHLTICPFVFGGRAAPTIADGRGADALARAAQLRLDSVRKTGDELFLIFRSKR
jgi:riboflavin-specific deaminase-like protein